MAAVLFHLTPEGPKPCKATKRACKYGGHFKSEAEAAQTYQAALQADHGAVATAVSRLRDGSPLAFPLTPTTQEVIARLSSAGIHPFIVGGSVRDQFLGKPSKDIDMELYGEEHGESLSFASIVKLFPRKEGWRVDEAGASFSVLKVRKGEEDFDLSLPRTEHSTGEGHTAYELHHDSRMSFEEAASRRDFTFNAMGWDPSTGKLVDPHGGAEDLRKGLIRHVGPAFEDDPLRPLRAVNFASRFPRMTMAEETKVLCQKLASSYRALPRERVEEEFTKVFTKGDHCDQGLGVLHDIGWSKVMPPFQKASREELVAWGARLNKSPKSLRRGVLAHSMTSEGHPDPTELLEGSSAGRAQVKLFRALAEASERGDQASVTGAHRLLRTRFPEVPHRDLVKALEAAGADPHRVKSLPETPAPPVVTGEKLLERGFKPGPEMGRLIKKAQRIQDGEALYDLDALLSRALSS